MFGFSALERTIAILTAENTDLRRTLADERAAWAAERTALLDRLMATLTPAATRELKRPASTPLPPPAIEVGKQPQPRRINFPGYGMSTPLPPYPKKGGDIPSEVN